MKESVQMMILVSFLPIVTNTIKVMFACELNTGVRCTSLVYFHKNKHHLIKDTKEHFCTRFIV